MRSMFQMGFDRQIFTERHPQIGLSFSEVSTWWKDAYPRIKEDLKPLTTQQLPKPGTSPTTAPRLPVTAPSSGPSTTLVVGGLAVLGLGAYYLLAKRPFGLKK